MGAGRKTETFTMQEKALAVWTSNCSVTARNLGKSKLAGVIFGCKHNTMQECLSKQLFGLPAPHYSYVRNINPGLPLFLFNYSDRKLHGIFEATSQGNLNISPYAWTDDGMDYTPYSAQVKIKMRMQCHPLLEDQFKPIISDNYYEAKLFWFELNQGQTNRLIALFSSSLISTTFSQSERATGLSKALQTTSVRKEMFSSNLNVACLDSKKKWSSLFKFSPTDSKEEPTFEINLSNSNHCGYEWEEPFWTSHSSKEESKSCKASGRGSEETEFFDSGNEVYSPSCSDVKVGGEEYESAAMEVNTPCSNLEGVAETTEGDANFKSDEENWLEDNHENIQTHTLEANNNDVDLNSDWDLVAQLLEEVRELKSLHEKQVQKTNLLQQELNLKSRCEILESGMNSKKSSMEGKELQSTKDIHASLDESVLIVGGFDGSWLSTMDCFDISGDSIESLPAMRSVRSQVSTTKLNGEISVLGGVNGKVWYDTVESYSKATNQWVSRPSLHQKKGSLAGVPFNDKIFAIGGGNGVECFSEVEMLDLDAGRWIQTPSMRHERFALAAGELNGIIYAVGGFDGKNYLQSAEMFDPREKSWREIGSMSTKRGCHCLAVLNEKLYALGGYSGDNFLSTVEVFDPRRGSWTLTEPMNESRGYFASAVIRDTIYVFGGLKDIKFSETSAAQLVEDLTFERVLPPKSKVRDLLTLICRHLPSDRWSVTKRNEVGS